MEKNVDLVTEVARKVATGAVRVSTLRRKVARSVKPDVAGLDQACNQCIQRCGCRASASNER